MSRPTYSFGASVRGPLHVREGRPCEDAWLHATGVFGTLGVACDGMGSKPNAREGARAACYAVKEAVGRWARTPDAPLSYLCHLIEVLWRLRVHPLDPASAVTTCLFALALPDGAWIAGGLGDGLVATRTDGNLEVLVGERGSAFGNETEGLGASRGVASWRVSKLPASSRDRLAVLATDGVADDLELQRLGAFCDWLVDSTRELSPAERWRWLSAELRDWPTPKHLDDKTLVVIHTPEVANA